MSNARDKRIFQQTIKSARLGVPEAQYEVALMYANGIGVPQSVEQAVNWLQQAAQRGMAGAQYLLGTRFESGIGVPQSVQLAMLWFGRAAEQNHVKAIYRLGRLHARTHMEQALALYQQAAEAGLAEAQYALANAYEKGLGSDVDPVWAVHWYRSAADQGLASAQFALGEMMLRGDGVLPDAEMALRLFRLAASQFHIGAKVAIERMELSTVAGERMRRHGKGRRQSTGAERRGDASGWIRAAETGDAEARYQLGQMYALGLGLEVDTTEAQRWYSIAAQQNHPRAQLALAGLLERQGNSQALEWYQRSAAQGEAQAQFALGRILCAGQTVTPDFLRGIGWYVKAAEQDHDLALVTLGNLFNSEMHHVAVHCFAQAAARGSAQAQFLLGEQYARGLGVAKHPARAFLWFEKAAVQRHAGAECAVGVAYLTGQGAEKNPKLAFHWLQRAAEQGVALAQWHLGAMFAAGHEGQPRDLTQALDWCQRAADQGFVAAQANLGVLYALLRRPDLAVQWWQKAAEQEDPEACYNLALAYMKGEGVDKDPQQAFPLLVAAAEAGVTAAQSKLGLMYVMGQGVSLDAVEGHKWLFLAAANGDPAAQVNLARSRSLCTTAQILEGERRGQAWEKARKAAKNRQK